MDEKTRVELAAIDAAKPPDRKATIVFLKALMRRCDFGIVLDSMIAGALGIMLWQFFPPPAMYRIDLGGEVVHQNRSVEGSAADTSLLFPYTADRAPNLPATRINIGYKNRFLDSVIQYGFAVDGRDVVAEQTTPCGMWFAVEKTISDRGATVIQFRRSIVFYMLEISSFCLSLWLLVKAGLAARLPESKKVGSGGATSVADQATAR